MSRPASSRSQAKLNRPASAQSRQAWSTDVGHDNDRFQGEDDAPAAMQSEIYDPTAKDPREDMEVQVDESKNGCGQRFSRVVRALWATRQTEDTTSDKEMHIKTTLRELLVYVLFLIVLCIVTFAMTSPTLFYYTKVMSELFLDSQFPDTKNTFRGMTSMADFWRFAESPLMDGLYWEKWYNGKNVSQNELGYIFYENKVLGVPRLRQLKVRNDSCTVHSDFQNEIKACFDVYAKSIEDKSAFGKMNGSAWTYHTESALDGSSHLGLISRYGGGGFIQNLATTMGKSKEIVADLKSNLWLDRGTRAVFVDFTVYNANINLFCVVRLLIEFPATGGAIPSWNFRTVKLIRYVTAGDYFVLACEAIFCLFICYYIVEEILEIKRLKFSYFKSFWNILDILVIMISFICIIFNIYRTVKVDKMLNDLLKKPEEYPDFEFLSFWQVQFNSAIAILVFLAWIKIFKYISFNKTMTQLSSTLARCAKDVGGFAVMFFIVFLAFAQLGYLIFGTQVKDFSSFPSAIFTLFRIILGDFNFHELEAANRVLGPLYFMLYVFFVFFVLLNMFLAIINDTYSEVKADMSNQQNEFEVGDYFKKSYDRMLDKLNIKRDKIIDIQKALKSADINQDKQLDFEEWRQDLKTRGYAEAEIEAVFAKYDLDGDRILDEDEQKKMQADLEGQKQKLNKDLMDVEAGDRPKSSLASESDEEEATGRTVSGVSYEEFVILARRVDRMEHSIGSIVSKIDAVLLKLEAMERAKTKRRETMSKLLDSISESGGDDDKREQMEKLVRDELEKWDSDGMGSSASLRQRPSSRPGSNMGTGNIVLGPADYIHQEPSPGLRYSKSLRCQKNKELQNEDPKDALLLKFRREIDDLRKKLQEDSDESGDESGFYFERESEDETNNLLLTRNDNELPEEKKIKTICRTNNTEEKSFKERLRIENILLEKQMELRRAEREKIMIKNKLLQIEKKIIVGGENLLEKAEEQERLLEESAKELDRGTIKQMELRRQLEEKEQEKLDIEEKYSSLQEEATGKTIKLNKIWSMLIKAKTELAEVQLEHQKEMEKLLENLRNLNKELHLQTLIIDNFIPFEYQEVIERQMDWNDTLGEWQLNCIAFTGDNMKKSRLVSRYKENMQEVDLSSIYMAYMEQPLEINPRNNDYETVSPEALDRPKLIKM